MVKIFIIFLIAIIILGILLGVAVAIQGRDHLKGMGKGTHYPDVEATDDESCKPGSEDPEEDFYDEDGNHIYYERSLIKKRKYAREHPEEEGELRTFRRLFSRK